MPITASDGAGQGPLFWGNPAGASNFAEAGYDVLLATDERDTWMTPANEKKLVGFANSVAKALGLDEWDLDDAEDIAENFCRDVRSMGIKKAVKILMRACDLAINTAYGSADVQSCRGRR
jgi:hypothetical protein